MSTSVYLVCMDHDPMLTSFGEIQEHISEHYVEQFKDLYAARDKFLEVENALDWGVSYDNPYTSNAVYFFKSHPKCRLAAVTEYNEYIDIGDGVPPDVKIWITHEQKKFNDQMKKNLDEIRQRDKDAIARLGKPDEDPLLRAEMDRRYLLTLVKDI